MRGLSCIKQSLEKRINFINYDVKVYIITYIIKFLYYEQNLN